MPQIDMQGALGDWPHDPEQVSVRKIVAVDGSVKVQMRVELGILQMEVQGRPDGVRPHERDTELVYQQERLAVHEGKNGTQLGFVLTPQECLALRVEASQFYRRYVALFVLEEYANVYRDTAHTLAIFDLCKVHGFHNDDRSCMEPYRPYVYMMDSRAHAYHALKENEPASALAHVNRGVMRIRGFLEERGQADQIESCQELKVLQQLGTEIIKQLPQDSMVVKHRLLQSAIAEERFEDAARLRDEIANNKDQKPE
ncbi:MAG: UvrB/UvrC motif-containing protein [Planctomycetota bacterium]